MNISQTPRFGASFNVNYGPNLKPAVFAQAAELATAQTELAGRVAQIKDQVDPIGINIQLANEGASAKLTTRENGEKSFAQAAGQSIADFAKSLVEQAETLAGTLVSQKQKNAEILKKADEYINSLLIAVTDSTPTVLAGDINSNDSYKLMLTFSGGGSFSVGGSGNNPGEGLQALVKEPYRFGIKYSLSDAMSPNYSSKFSVATKQGQVILLTYTPAGGKEVDLLNASDFDAAKAAKISQKALKIFNQTEQTLRRK